MTGAELAALLKAHKPEIPILLVSGYAELPEGVDATLPKLNKPYSLPDLEQRLRALVMRRATEDTYPFA